MKLLVLGYEFCEDVIKKNLKYMKYITWKRIYSFGENISHSLSELSMQHVSTAQKLLRVIFAASFRDTAKDIKFVKNLKNIVNSGVWYLFSSSSAWNFCREVLDFNWIKNLLSASFSSQKMSNLKLRLNLSEGSLHIFLELNWFKF